MTAPTRTRLFTLLVAVSLAPLAQAVAAHEQHPPFWAEIQRFKQHDQQDPPPRDAIVFVGSSSFRRWSGMQEAFPDHAIINRGFGGATLPDVIRYVGEVVLPYHPAQVVIYCGDNDAASSAKVSADTILDRFKALYGMIRGKLPGAKISYVSIKPSPSRERLMPVMQKANWEIRMFLAGEPRASFIDVWHPMLDEFGRPREELFVSDRLHVNEKGYSIWRKAILPHLIAGVE